MTPDTAVVDGNENIDEFRMEIANIELMAEQGTSLPIRRVTPG